MALGFGSSWREYDDDDSSMAISGSMKEDLRREAEEENINMFSHWKVDSQDIGYAEALEEDSTCKGRLQVRREAQKEVFKKQHQRNDETVEVKKKEKRTFHYWW